MCNIKYIPLLCCNFHHNNWILLLRQWCHHDSLDDTILKERAAYITRVQKFMNAWTHVVWSHVLCRKTDRPLYHSWAFFHSVFCCVGSSVTAHVRLALVQGCDKCLSLLWGLSGLIASWESHIDLVQVGVSLLSYTPDFPPTRTIHQNMAKLDC